MTDECPTPDKLTFRSAAAARRHYRRMHRPAGAKAHLHPYECVCGAWHLTRQTPEQQREIAARIAAQTPAASPLHTVHTPVPPN